MFFFYYKIGLLKKKSHRTCEAHVIRLVCYYLVYHEKKNYYYLLVILYFDINPHITIAYFSLFKKYDH